MMYRKIFAICVLLLTLAAPAWAGDVWLEWGQSAWWNGNNYIAPIGHTSIADRIQVRGTVTLTLNDGCELTASSGIHVPAGSRLTIKAGGPAGTGKLIANAGDHFDIAGIGGNKDGTPGSITIEGGTIMATGGGMGAGIGGGYGGSGGDIRITGGTIKATGGNSGAGIGGGMYGGCGNIIITGGNIEARSILDGGAGIGRGLRGLGGNITITGGTVRAKGGKLSNSAWAAGIGGDNRIRGRGALSSGANGSAWIFTEGVNTDMTGFTSGVLFDGKDGAVYGDLTIKENAAIPSGKTLTIEDGQALTVPAGKTLTVSKGATLTLESGGRLANDGDIVNDGLVRLPEGSDLKGFKITGSGVIEIGGKVVPKEPTQKEKDAAKKIIDKIKGDGSAASGIRAADADPMEADVNDGDILFDTETVEGALCTMSIKVKAEPDQYAIIANGQMVDVAPGSSTDDDDATKAKLVYVDRFFATKGAAKSSDIELNEVSIEDEDEGAAELDATIVVINGRASNEVQAMPEYRPSGLVDGQGLAIFWDDEFKMNVLVVFDGDETDGWATDLIYAKEVAEETPQKSSSGGACATGAAAVVAIAALTVMERRKK